MYTLLPRAHAAKPLKMSTFCPICREICTWYRQDNHLFGCCEVHQIVEKIEVTKQAS